MREILLSITLFISINACAQDGMLEGKVRSEEGPLPFANVQLSGKDFVKGTATDSSGYFRIDKIPAGNYTLKISSLNYKTLRTSVEIDADENLQKDFTLKEDLLNLEQVVVTGTRNKVPVYEAPVIVSKISGKTFEQTQSLNISEGLNFSPGLRVETNCQNCGFTQLRMNGLEGAYSQILINSRPIFSALAGVYGLDMIPSNMVERIEVVKGGGSVLYGGNAIAGTVNIITKDPVENAFQIGYNQAFTGIEKPDRTISFNGSIVSEDLQKGISLYGYNRNRQPWDANGDGFSEVTLLKNTTFGFDAFWNISEQSKLKLNFHSINEFRRGGNKFDLAPHQTDVTEQLKHNILGAGLSFDHYSKDNKHHISAYGSAQLTDRDSYYGGGGRILSENDTLSESDLLAINAYGTSEDIAAVAGTRYTYALLNQAEITVGAEYQYNAVTDEMPGYQRKIDQTVGVIGSYLQVEWDPIDRLCIIAGGRFDHIAIDGQYDFEAENFKNERKLNVVVPRLSILYKLTKSIKARASFAQGYRAPQAFDEDLHIETVGGAARFIRLDPQLETERSNNITASLNYTSTIGKTQANIVLEGFFTQLRNPFILSDQRELPSGISIINKRNGDGARVQGANLEASLAFSKKVTLQAGFTGQTAVYKSEEELWAPEDESDPRSPTTTKRLLRTPNFYGFYTLTYNPIENLGISWSGVYTGPMEVAHIIDPETEYTVIERTPHFFDTNLKLSYTHKMKKDFYAEFFAGIQNILNSYQSDFDRGAERDAGYVYGPSRPRSIFFGMNFGLGQKD